MCTNTTVCADGKTRLQRRSGRGTRLIAISACLAYKRGSCGVADPHLESENNQRNYIPRDTRIAPATPGDRAARRAEQRLGADTSAVLHLISLTADVQGRIMDISHGGCHTRTDRRFPVGVFRRVEIEFRIEGCHFASEASYRPSMTHSMWAYAFLI